MFTLIRKASNSWAVFYPDTTSVTEVSVKYFMSIELASDFMVKELKVDDDAIDEALMELYALDTYQADFDDKGLFKESR